MAEAPDEQTKIDDLLAGYTGPAGKQPPRAATGQKTSTPMWRLPSKRDFLIIAVAVGAGIVFAVVNAGRTSTASQEQVEACRWEMISMGIDIERYDLKKAYVRDVYNETNAPMPTRINGEPIKCVLVPRFGAQQISGQCPLFNPPAEDHWACRLVYDNDQAIWVPTWKAERSNR